jgi:hypothetical protein
MVAFFVTRRHGENSGDMAKSKAAASWSAIANHPTAIYSPAEEYGAV